MASDSLQNTDEITKSLRSLLNISQTSSSDNIELPNLHSSIPAGTMHPRYHNNNHGRRPGNQNWLSANNSYFYGQGSWQAGYDGSGYLPFINNPPFYPCPSFTPYGFPPPPRSIGNFSGQVPMPPPLLPHFQSWYSPLPDFKKQNLILNQINYYFSDENLATDLYLRRQMDSNGWVPITLIAGFRRIAHLTDDIQLIIFALQRSSFVEVRDYKIRKRNNWLKWVLPCSGAQHLENSSVNMLTDRKRSLTTSVDQQ